METKLDLVLRDFAEKEEKLGNFRRNSIMSAASRSGGVAGGTIAALGRTYARAMKDTGLSSAEILLAAGVPLVATMGLKAGLTARNLTKTQEYLDSVGGADNLTDEQVNKIFSKINNGTIISPESYQLYIPEKEYEKLKAQEMEVRAKYPLDKSMKKTPEYKQNKALREEALKDVRTQQARALLKYAKLSNTTKKSV